MRTWFRGLSHATRKNAVHDLEAKDLRALTLEASLFTGIPLAGTDFSLTPATITDAVLARLGEGGPRMSH